MPAQEDMTKPEHIQVASSFREEIHRRFAQFYNFYLQTDEVLRRFRLLHVDAVTKVYNDLMEVMGDRLEEVRRAYYDLNVLVDAKQVERGRIDFCLRSVMDARKSISATVGSNIQLCAATANSTLAGMLRNTFYPTFHNIQEETNVIPVTVIDALSRGNVAQDEQAILRGLDERYRTLEFPWVSSVSQTLTWETSRFRNDGRSLSSDTERCMDVATSQFIIINSKLQEDIKKC